MRASTRNWIRKALKRRQVLTWLERQLHVLEKQLMTCHFCNKLLWSESVTDCRVTFHHINNDREPGCPKTGDICGHQLEPAHESCHKSHHAKERARDRTGRGRNAAEV